ncbi:MAG: ABC transporter permease [Anaerolineae bacterium]|nr:ABC transporter permease [Anaerolineae bacterium]
MNKTLTRPFRSVWAFLVRDYYVETSYRLSFLFTIGGVVVRALIFFFLSEFIEAATGGLLGDYGGDYFSFVIIGIALGGYFSTGLSSFADALRQSQTTGTLEAMILTPTPVSWLIIGSAAWSYVYTTFRVLIYLMVGSLFLGLDLSRANYAAALVVLLLSIVSFASLGIMAASVIMVIKRGNPITAVFGNVSNLIGGVFYPVAILPPGLQLIAYLLPITYSLRAMRGALLAGATWSELAPDLLALCLFCLVLLPLALFVFRYAVDRARAEGSLAQY